MAKIVKCVFDSRPNAEAAQQYLLRNGFEKLRIRIESGRPTSVQPRQRGDTEPDIWGTGHSVVNGIVEGIFSRMVPKSKETALYARALHEGKAILSVFVPNETTATRVRSALARVSDEIGRGALGTEQTSATPTSIRPKEPLDADIVAMIRGPEARPLPNSPIGWGETRYDERVSFGEYMNDPGRPKGLVEDVQGIGEENDNRLNTKETT